jgi:hypothetical protein
MAGAVTLPELHWRESPNQSGRLEPVRFVTVHRPVGSYASAIETLCDPQPAHPERRVSAHVAVREDCLEATQLVAWNRKAWHCAGFNSASEGVETPDWIWTGPLTADALRVMAVCARIVAFRLHRRGWPARWLQGGALLSGRGFTRHFDLGAAGGGHTDPTTDPHRWGIFAAMVRHELARGHFRPAWGRYPPAATLGPGPPVWGFHG